MMIEIKELKVIEKNLHLITKCNLDLILNGFTIPILAKMSFKPKSKIKVQFGHLFQHKNDIVEINIISEAVTIRTSLKEYEISMDDFNLILKFIKRHDRFKEFECERCT